MATTSGTSSFNLDLPDLIEEAYEMAGVEMRSGYDLRTARRSLSLLSLELANRGLNLFTVTEGSQALSDGTATYSLGPDVIDLIEFVVRTGTGTDQTDYTLTRISVSDYADRVNKNNEARPNEIYVDRQTDGVNVTLWPVPDSSDYTLVYWYLRRIEDLGDNTNNYDAPERFLPAICAGLAVKLAIKKNRPDRVIALLKNEYAELLTYAFREDRQKTPLTVRPYRGRI